MKPPKKGSKEWSGLIKSNVWGIHYASAQVVSVTIYNGGSMTLWMNGVPRQHRGHSASREEASTVFGLVDTIETSVHFPLDPAKKAELEEKAAKLREEREQAKSTATEPNAPDGD
jgi:hypothetical protein